MASDTVLILCATLGFTVAIITIVICVGCMYCKYIKWVKYPAIHPAQQGNENLDKNSKPQTDRALEKVHQMENGDTGAKQTYLKTGNGEVIKPNLYINQDILTFYRNVCIQNTTALISPPAKVPQLYREESMTEFEQEERRLFKALRHQSRAIERHKSRVKTPSSVLPEGSFIAVMPLSKHKNVNGPSNDCSHPTDLFSARCKCNRSDSMVTIISDIEEHHVEPSDVQLGDF